MSIALSTLVLFFLLIPGIIFRRFYYSEEFSKEYFKENFFGVFISTVIPSLFFHFLWYFAVRLFDHKVDLFVLADIVSQKPSEASFENIDANAWNILFYNASIFIASGLLGRYIKNLVRNRKWDRTFKFFRFQNSWHYILKGEFFDFPRADIYLENDTVEDIEFVFIDAIVEICGTPYLYDGILVDYELSSSGLDTISLSHAQRRKMEDDSPISANGEKEDNFDKYYQIDGHILVLKYSEVKNLNFTYFTLEKKNQGYEPRLVS